MTRAGRREWAGLAVLALPTLLASMDLTVLQLATPHLSAALQPTGTQLLWITDIYGFMIAGSLITMGTLGDRIGRRRLLLCGAAMFGVVSVAAAFSTSAAMLIVTRAALGIAGATLLPSSLALIRDMFGNDKQRAFAIGVWAAVFSAGTALGPVLGGVLLEQFWWGSVFLLGVPAMSLLLVLGPLLLPESCDDDAGRLDLVSVALAMIGVLGIIYGLKRFVDDSVDWVGTSAIVLGVVTAVAFVLRQRSLADPLIDLRLFRLPAFSSALGIQTLALFAWAGSYFFLAQYLQTVIGLSPLAAGLWLVPAACGSIVGSMLAPVCASRMSSGVVFALALLLSAAGFAVLAQADGLALAVIGSVVFSLGVAPCVTEGTNVIVSAAPPERAGAAAGISETGTELGMALGIAIVGSIGTAVYRGELRMPGAVPPWAAESARGTVGSAQEVANQLPDPVGTELLTAALSAFTRAVQVTAAVSAAVAAALIPVALLLLRFQPAKARSASPSTDHGYDRLPQRHGEIG